MPKRYFAKPKRRGAGRGVAVFAALIVLLLAAGAGYLYRHGRPALLGPGTVDLAAARAALEEARGLAAKGEFGPAGEKLAPLLKLKDPVLTPQAIVVQADVDAGMGNPDAAMAGLSQAMNDYRTSPEYPALACRYARQLEKANRRDEARGLYESLRDNAPGNFKAAGLCGLARLKEAEGGPLAARDLYRSALDAAGWGSPEWNEAADPLGKLNVELIFSASPTPESRYYMIERGDSITSIGNKLNTTQGLLLRANNLTESSVLAPGGRLKYTPKDFSIIIERSACQLYLFDTKGLFKRYHAGLGMPGHETALGKYTIGNKQKDPTWFKPGAGPITSGEPDNELGTRWMPLVPAESNLPTDLGIHGTIHPETVGQYSSHGCARLLNGEVEELYDLVVRSTPVTIVEKYEPGAAPAAAGGDVATAVPAPAEGAAAEGK